MIKIEIYTDGACNQQKNTGGWAFLILENGELKIKKSGPEINTTNNKCEMLAVIKAFDELETLEFFQEMKVVVYSDSAYLVNAFNKDWISNWLANGWINSEKKPVANKEYWESLIYYKDKFKAEFIHIARRSNSFAIQVDNMAKKPSLN